MIGWALRASADVDTNWRLRTKFVLSALANRSAAARLQNAPEDSPVGRLIREWPDAVGYLLWPYQCSAWDPDERLSRIDGHQKVVESIPGLDLAPDDKLVLADLSWISPDVSLIIDRPKWLSREGLLTLSLFKGDFRAFTISFSLSRAPDLEVFIGGIQGRQTDNVLSLYRDLTKDFHGMRPRDFLLEAMRLFALSIGATRIHAVMDKHKISHHEFFGKRGAPGLFYDEIWEERGGTKVAETHYELPLEGSRRDLEEVPSKKRSMYRRRYEMLDRIGADLPTDLSTAERKHFDAI